MTLRSLNGFLTLTIPTYMKVIVCARCSVTVSFSLLKITIEHYHNLVIDSSPWYLKRMYPSGPGFVHYYHAVVDVPSLFVTSVVLDLDKCTNVS